MSDHLVACQIRKIEKGPCGGETQVGGRQKETRRRIRRIQ